MFRVFIAGLVACLYLSTPANVLAQESVRQEPVLDVVKKMKDVFRPVRPSMRKVEITMTAGGETIKWVARQCR